MRSDFTLTTKVEWRRLFSKVRYCQNDHELQANRWPPLCSHRGCRPSPLSVPAKTKRCVWGCHSKLLLTCSGTGLSARARRYRWCIDDCDTELGVLGVYRYIEHSLADWFPLLNFGVLFVDHESDSFLVVFVFTSTDFILYFSTLINLVTVILSTARWYLFIFSTVWAYFPVWCKARTFQHPVCCFAVRRSDVGLETSSWL